MFYSNVEVNTFVQTSSMLNTTDGTFLHGFCNIVHSFVTYDAVCKVENRPILPLALVLKREISVFSADEIAKLIREAFLNVRVGTLISLIQPMPGLWHIPHEEVFQPGPSHVLQVSSLQPDINAWNAWKKQDQVCICIFKNELMIDSYLNLDIYIYL